MFKFIILQKYAYANYKENITQIDDKSLQKSLKSIISWSQSFGPLNWSDKIMSSAKLVNRTYCNFSTKLHHLCFLWDKLEGWARLCSDIHHSTFGMTETLNLKRFHGIAKACGVLFSIAGVIVLAFYQGPEFRPFHHHNIFHQTSNLHTGITAHPTRLWILGIFLTTLSTTSWALWTVLQVRIFQEIIL